MDKNNLRQIHFGTGDNVSGNKVVNIYSEKKEIDKFLNLVPNYDYRLIIDRIDITADIRSILNDTPEIVIISGVGGIGKTTIALAYCNNPEIVKLYDHIAWVTVTDDLQNDLMNKLSNDETGFKYYEELSQEENFYNCLSTLSKIKGNNLLIIDNANNSTEILHNKEKLESLRWKVLLTSRTRPDECKILNIDELELLHCRELFQRFYKKPDNENEILNHLLKHINCHTLLTELLAKSGNKNPILNISKLYELIQKQDSLKEPLLQKKITISNPQATQKEIDREFKLYDYIIAIFGIETLNEKEKQYLRYFSILPSIEISFEQLMDFFTISELEIIDFSDILDDLVKKGWLIQNIFQNDGIQIITYKCHNLIQVVLREKLSSNSENCASLLKYFQNISHHSKGDNFTVKKWIVPFCENIVSYIDDNTIDLSIFLQDYSDYLRRLGNRILPTKYAKKALDIRIANSNEENIELSKSYYNYARTLGVIGKYQESIEYKMKALKIREKELSLDDVLIAKACLGIGNDYRTLGEYESSIYFHKRAINIYENNIKVHVLDLADIYDAIGHTCSKMNDLNLSLEYRMKSLELRDKFFDNKKHPSFATSYNNIGSVLSKLHRLDDALKYHIMSLEIKKESYDNLSPSIAISYNNIAIVYRKQRKFELAKEFNLKSIDLKLQIYNSEFHTSLAFSYQTLAEIYFDEKSYISGKEYIEKVNNIREHFYKSTNTDFVKSKKLYLQIEFSILETNFWKFRKELKLSNDIIPVNLQIEKENFISKYQKNIKHNPQFEYEKNENIDKINEFKEYLAKFENTDFLLTALYKQNISEDIEWITKFNQRDYDFNNWLSSIHGRPSEEIYNKALETINSIKEVKTSERTITAKQAQEFMISKLAECGYTNWKVEIVNNSAKMSVNGLLQTVKVKDTAMFTENELKRLFVHEIETHILRNENGKTQRYEMFTYGFPDNIASEEGLAILAEQLNNLRDETDELRYALRVVLCYNCFEMDFYDLFKIANSYFDEDRAFDMVARVKRGLTDTSQFGGYTKDQAYFIGYHQIKDLPKETLKKLYIGKIGIQHLDLINQFDDLNYNVRIPQWIENME